MTEGLDLAQITEDARRFVATLSDAEVKRRLTDKLAKERRKKEKAAKAKALKKEVDAQLTVEAEKRGIKL